MEQRGGRKLISETDIKNDIKNDIKAGRRGRVKKVLRGKYKTASGLFSWENARNEIFGEEQSTTHSDRIFHRVDV